MEKAPLPENCRENVSLNVDYSSKKEEEETRKKPDLVDKENYHDAVEYMDISENEDDGHFPLVPVDQQQLPVDATHPDCQEPPAQTTRLLPRKSLLATFDPLFESDLSNSKAAGDLNSIVELVEQVGDLNNTTVVNLNTAEQTLNNSVGDLNNTTVVESNEEVDTSIGDLDTTRVVLGLANEPSEPAVTENIPANPNTTEQINTSVGDLNDATVVLGLENEPSESAVTENISANPNTTEQINTSVGDLNDATVVLGLENEPSEPAVTENISANPNTTEQINTSVGDLNDATVVLGLENEPSEPAVTENISANPNTTEQINTSVGDLNDTTVVLGLENEPSEPAVTEIISASLNTAVEQFNNSVGDLKDTSIEHLKEDISTSLNDTASEKLDLPEKSLEIANSDSEVTAETVEIFEPNLPSAHILLKAMADVTDKLALQEEENAELKLQLNASQQVRATLELQLRQKEEIIIKSQAESLRKDQAYKQEIKQLKEKLEEKLTENDNSSQTKELQEMLKALKAREAKLLSEINARKNDEANYRKIMDEYEKTIAAQLTELQKVNEEHETVKRHLANLELAFSDVHQKYERSKKIIDGYKCNEDALRQALISSEDSVIKSEEKYESLKAHAKAQIEKSNQEMQLLREQYESEIHKLSAIIKRLEIKNASLADSLDQKTKECSALAALCDEVTGKV